MTVQFAPGDDRLPEGLHQVSPAEMKALLVDPFPTSTTRGVLYDRWLNVREAIRRIVPVQSEWLNGSYVTTKENPGDIDMITFLDPQVDQLDQVSRTMLLGLIARDVTQVLHGCHSFPVVAYPSGHPGHAPYQAAMQYWQSWFGTDRQGTPKGFLEIV